MNIFGAVVLALAQVIHHPAPFQLLVSIPLLYEQLRSLDCLMTFVVFIQIVFINEKPRLNHIKIAPIIDP